MSERALKYYQEQADALCLDSDFVPLIFNGQPQPLLSEGSYISVGHIAATSQEAVNKLDEVLQTTHTYLFESVADHPDYPINQVPQIQTKNADFTEHFLQKTLLHTQLQRKGITAGEVSNIYLAAIARPETNIAWTTRLDQQSYSSIANVLGKPAEAYFTIYGDLEHDGISCKLGGLLIARAVHHIAGGHGSFRGSTAIHYAGVAKTPFLPSKRRGRALSE